MKATATLPKCRCCRTAFVPDYRNGYHQQFCSKPQCQRASKQASQRRWLRKAENQDYFRGPENVRRVQEWRKSNPQYWKSASSANRSTLQENWFPGIPGKMETRARSSEARPSTLQEVCRESVPLILGLIAQVGHCTLQEDIAARISEMVTKGQCILDQFSREPLGESRPLYRQTDLPFA